MTYSPDTWIDVRKVFQRETGLPAVSLGIQHYLNRDGTYTGGGGYHAGNDLLAKIGKQTTDYSKRESTRDQPGTNGASAIDLGWFDVNLRRNDGSFIRVTLRTLNAWLLQQVDKPDALWIREIIYSLDGKTVKRYDRLKKRTSGDLSHLTHSHVSGFRDDEGVPKAPLFERFWREMRGVPMTQPTSTARLEWNAHMMETPAPGGGKMLEVIEGGAQNPVSGRPYQLGIQLNKILANQATIIAGMAASAAREEAMALALTALAEQVAAGDPVDVPQLMDDINAKVSEVRTAVLDELTKEPEK